MRSTRKIWSGILLGALLCLSSPSSWAQEPAAAPKPAAQERPKPAPEAQKPVRAYRLDFSVYEIEGGKKVNTRQYSFNVETDDTKNVRIGTRVPVEGPQGQFQYLDVGTSVSCRLNERDDLLLLDVRSEISSFAIPEQQDKGGHPILRQLSINASTIATPGKSMVIGSVDDPGSPRQYQLEVIATRLK